MEMTQWTKSDIGVSQYADSHMSTQLTTSVLIALNWVTVVRDGVLAVLFVDTR